MGGVKLRILLTIAAPVGLVAVLALNDGGFDLALRQQVWLVVWWAVALGLTFGRFPRAIPPHGWIAAAGGLAAIALLEVAAVAWAPSVETAMADAARTVGYLGILALAWAGLGSHSWRHAALGLLIVAAGVTVFALAGRLAPSLAGLSDVERSIGTERLYAPLGYWNAMGAWAAVTLVMAVAWSADARRPSMRACALALVPLAGVVVYLTYSRGAVLALAVGLGIVLGLTRNRARALIHLAVGAVATGLCIAAVRSEPAIATGDSGDGGVVVGLCLLLVAAGTWLIAARSTARLRRAGTPDLARPIAPARVALVVGTLVIGLVVVAAAGGRDGIGGNEEVVSVNTADPSTRLVSADGPRTAYWLEAIDGFAAQPLRGEGPGSFANRWAEEAQDSALVKDAHSLPFETASELGVLGLTSLAIFVAATIAILLIGLRRAERSAAAVGLLAAVAVFGVSAAIDWTWESTALATLGLGCAGVLSMAGSTSLRHRRREQAASHPPWLGWRWVAVGIAILFGAFQVPAVVAQGFLEEAEEQRLIGDADSAIANAEQALTAAPWSAAAYVALAKARLDAGDPDQARGDALEAIDREPREADHRILLALIEAERDDLPAAAAALGEAVRLSPYTLRLGSPEVAAVGRRLEDFGITTADIIALGD